MRMQTNVQQALALSANERSVKLTLGFNGKVAECGATLKKEGVFGTVRGGGVLCVSVS